ncbi:MAG: hypothetical protein IH626_23125 [Rhodospirillales bacterium]|nr:hypothetical protein [Rhodospirillales bacterium]
MRLRHPLARDIALALVVKVLALAALYVAFFSPAHRLEVTPEIMQRAILGAASAVVPGRSSPAFPSRATEYRRNVHHV